MKKRKRMNRKKNNLKRTLKKLDEEISANLQTAHEDKINALREKQREIETIRTSKTLGTILRSKARSVDKGEKPTRYFLNLEKRNNTSKLIPKIITDDGKDVTSCQDILDEQRKFYKKLYSERSGLPQEEIKEYLKTLNKQEADALEGKITYKKLTAVLKNQKNNKSPGIDGRILQIFLERYWLFCTTSIK